jgi:hypothetical protein
MLNPVSKIPARWNYRLPRRTPKEMDPAKGTHRKTNYILFRFPHFCVFLIPVHSVGVLVYGCVEWCSNIVSQWLVWFPLLVGAVSKSLIKHSGNVFIKVINKRWTLYVWSNFMPLEIITRTSVQYLLQFRLVSPPPASSVSSPSVRRPMLCKIFVLARRWGYIHCNPPLKKW